MRHATVSFITNGKSILSGMGMPQLPNNADLDRMHRHTQLCLRAEGPVHRYIQHPLREKNRAGVLSKKSPDKAPGGPIGTRYAQHNPQSNVGPSSGTILKSPLRPPQAPRAAKLNPAAPVVKREGDEEFRDA